MSMWINPDKAERKDQILNTVQPSVGLDSNVKVRGRHVHASSNQGPNLSRSFLLLVLSSSLSVK